MKRASYLESHRAHDHKFLIQRWRAVARTAGLEMRSICPQTSGHKLFVVKSKKLGKSDGIYISAGIHGDEPAGAEALILWAEQNVKRLAQWPLLIFPCLNPWGLTNNSRVDQDGRDLNRHFHSDELPLIRAVKDHTEPHRFALALTLHEDFDGQGLYLYEVERTTPYWGEDLLNIARPIIPVEGRVLIDGRRAGAGIVRRKVTLKKFAAMGLPEAVWLHLNHSARTFTIETPSEFALDRRVQTHLAIINECVRRVFLL